MSNLRSIGSVTAIYGCDRAIPWRARRFTHRLTSHYDHMARCSQHRMWSALNDQHSTLYYSGCMSNLRSIVSQPSIWVRSGDTVESKAVHMLRANDTLHRMWSALNDQHTTLYNSGCMSWNRLTLNSVTAIYGCDRAIPWRAKRFTHRLKTVKLRPNDTLQSAPYAECTQRPTHNSILFWIHVELTLNIASQPSMGAI